MAVSRDDGSPGPLPWVGLVGLVGALGASCVAPPRMCAAESDCGPQASCVSGRCVPHGATAAIATARRLVVGATEVGWVRRGGAATAGVATLGRDGARLFLRFALPLTAEVEVLEAYVLLERAPAIDADPVPVALHAERVTSAWDPTSLSWARQPSTEPLGAPVTRVTAASGPLVRIDVRALVEQWRKRAPGEQGLAIVAEGESATGVTFALAPADVPEGRVESSLAAPAASVGPASGLTAGELEASGRPLRQVAGPRVELYVR